MGTNWNSGLIYWKDHTPSRGARYSLAHLHPFLLGSRASCHRPASRPLGRAACVVRSAYVHARGRDARWRPQTLSRQPRGEDILSDEIPAIPRTARHHPLARQETTRIRTRIQRPGKLRDCRNGGRYALRGVAVHLMVQSAYVLEPGKPAPGKGRIHFHALLGHALRGTTPRPPP